LTFYWILYSLNTDIGKKNFYWRNPRVNKIPAGFKRLTDILRGDEPRVFRNGERRGGEGRIGGEGRRGRKGAHCDTHARRNDRMPNAERRSSDSHRTRNLICRNPTGERTRPTVIGRERICLSAEHAGDARHGVHTFTAFTPYVRSSRNKGKWRPARLHENLSESAARRRKRDERHACIARRAFTIIMPINGDALSRRANENAESDVASWRDGTGRDGTRRVASRLDAW